MKTRILIVLTVLCVTSAHARKSPPILPDTMIVVPGHSGCINFWSGHVGLLTQIDSSTWLINEEKFIKAKSFSVVVTRAVEHPGDLFGDCVLFKPREQACLSAGRHVFYQERFFIGADPNNGERAGHTVVPSSIRFYTDTTGMQHEINGNTLTTPFFPEEKVQDYLQSFYFRKYEVSNKEYREFVNWVLDSTVRARMKFLLPNGNLDYKKKYDFDKDSIGRKLNLYLPVNERFYSRLDIDSRKLVYKFTNIPAGFSIDTLRVYPDTLSWLHDWSLSFNEPMCNMYFWHPAYEAYPVVGVNYWQCLAFLEWKTRKLQSVVDKKGLHMKVLCKLPTEIEWDYASTAENEKGKIILAGGNYSGTADHSWLTDLSLYRNTATDVKVVTEEPDFSKDQVLSPGRSKPTAPVTIFAYDYDHPFRLFDLTDEKTWGDFIYDGYFHTGPANIPSGGIGEDKKLTPPTERSEAHFDAATGICWLDGNVSEWMREDVDVNWRGIFTKHFQVPDGPYSEDQKFIRNYEKHYYDELPLHGKLVRGCNWYDERFAMKYGKNVGGSQAKTFCDPNKAHSTLGFRYVIYLEAAK